MTQKMKKSAVALYCGNAPAKRKNVHALMKNSGEEKEGGREGGKGGKRKRWRKKKRDSLHTCLYYYIYRLGDRVSGCPANFMVR